MHRLWCPGLLPQIDQTGGVPSPSLVPCLWHPTAFAMQGVVCITIDRHVLKCCFDPSTLSACIRAAIG